MASRPVWETGLVAQRAGGPAHGRAWHGGHGSGQTQALRPLHKDFYFKHPGLQCAEFCWGNLEAAHPVLSLRSDREVADYRFKHGIEVYMHGDRATPKPFQSFAETSFPTFVEELAYELFTEDAVPFAVQAQVWPCALSGMDVVGVAPTGSGKTLTFLLPALVHVMAQEHLAHGEGPIALVLVPTREIALQTLSVARQFCNRTSGEDTLRVGAAYGGVDARQQAPGEGAPDFGRWPEILVATPGRLLDLALKKQWLSLLRVSYVVLDEADNLLTPGDWLPQIDAILAEVRPDRQLLMFSATWPAEAEAAAVKRCSKELVQIRVHPAVPQIPQALRLFPGLEGEASFLARRAELIRWLSEELKQDEAVLVLFNSRNTASTMAGNKALQAAVGGAEAIALLQAPQESGAGDERSAYQRFVHGQVRVLFASFSQGSRGLDYADTAALPNEAATPLALVVILFDFPPTLGEYAHCIGRTARPGQKEGRVLAFLPENRFWMARELVSLLEHCGQPVPWELTELLTDDRRFLDQCRQAMLCLREGQSLCPDTPGDQDGDTQGLAGFCGGDFDATRGVWILPPDLPSYRRKLLHSLSDELGLPHVSSDGPRGERRLHVARQREVLPEKFFIEGEEVMVTPPEKGAKPLRGVVFNPRVHRYYQTVGVRFPNGYEEQIPVSAAEPCLNAA